MRLVPDADEKSLDAPELFTERLLQFRLTAFWKSCRLQTNTDELYDPLVAEERYNKFQIEFLSKLPAPFRLHGFSREWDKQLPRLPMQRQLLFTTVFESVCQNFRPLLLLHQQQVQGLPVYKQVLIRTQRQMLAHAALSMLEAVTTLHDMLGASHTRSTSVIIPTFEASVLLLCLSLHESPIESMKEQQHSPDANMEHESHMSASEYPGRERCIQAAQDGLARLRMLAEVSVMAGVGAENLSLLLQQVTATSLVTDSSSTDDQFLSENMKPIVSQPTDLDLSSSNTTVSSTSELFSADFSHFGSINEMFLSDPEQFRYFIDHTTSMDTRQRP